MATKLDTKNIEITILIEPKSAISTRVPHKLFIVIQAFRNKVHHIPLAALIHERPQGLQLMGAVGETKDKERQYAQFLETMHLP